LDFELSMMLLATLALWSATASGKYSCAATLEEIRDKSQEAEWWKLIWFQLTIPKHDFIGCLVINIRLSAKDKLIKWGWDSLVNWGTAHLKGKGLRACICKLAWW
jgi:hypothetical protein